jgi:type II secretory pathway component PulC
MKNRKLIFLAFALFIFYATIRLVSAGFTASKVLNMTPPDAIGMGGELQVTVTRLETDIGERMAYDVKVKSDPLKLSRIINARGQSTIVKAEIAESLNQLRLSCTIISPTKSTAIIKHQGKSFVVSIGDDVNGRKVIDIDKKRVVLRYNGEDIELFNRPAPLGEIRSDSKGKLEQLEL